MKITYNDKTYSSAMDLCQEYGIKYYLFLRQLKDGYSIDAAIDRCLIHTSYRRKPCVSDLVTVNGCVYASITDACNNLGINRGTVVYRLKQGATIEEAFSTEKWKFRKRTYKKHRGHKGTPTQDHLGNWFPSVSAMCRHYGIKPVQYACRINLKWSKADALTKETRPLTKPVTDHFGNHYDSQSEMCAAYNISHTLFCKRIERGWDLSDALTTPPRERKISK